MPSPTPPSRGLRRVVAAIESRPRLTVAVAAVLPFLGTLGYPSILDDGWAALDNPLVWSLRNVGRIFFEPYGFAGDPSLGGPYRPITTLTYALDYAVHGRWTPGFHAVNVALHALASVLVWALARRLLRTALPDRAERGALLCGLLFALHPAHVEAVATIFGRTEPLAAVFTLGALLAALRWREAPWRLPVAVLLLTLGVLSKEIAVVAPALFLLVAFAAPGAAGLQVRPGLRDTARRRALLVAAGISAALALSAVPYLLVRGLDLGAPPVARWFPVGTPRSHVALTMSRVLGEYLRILAFPSFLGGDFAYAVRIPTLSAPDAAFWTATVAWVATLGAGAALLVSRRAPLEGAGLLWAFVALTPVMHLVPVGVLLAERLLYLPSAGFCLAAGAALARLAPANAAPPPLGRRARLALALPVAVAGLLAVRTVARTLDWRSPVALWESEAAKAPRHVVVNNNLAAAYSARGEHARAAERLEIALAENPWYWRAWVNLGIARRHLGQRERALAAFQRGVELAPGQPEPLLHLALFLEADGDVDGAVARLARARSLRPEDATLARTQGEILLRAGRREEARAALEAALRLDAHDAASRRLLDGLR